jgi:hypothetical protein
VFQILSAKLKTTERTGHNTYIETSYMEYQRDPGCLKIEKINCIWSVVHDDDDYNILTPSENCDPPAEKFYVTTLGCESFIQCYFGIKENTFLFKYPSIFKIS